MLSKIREVNVFSIGDSEKISTWSNVPYFFVRSLMAQGLKVNRVDIDRSLLGKILNRTVWGLIRKMNGPTTYDYFRSRFHFNNVSRKIKRTSKHYAHAQANIFLTFSFSSAELDNKPSILFCDWTYDHYLKYFANKKPDRRESASVEREDRQIEGADAVFVLFPVVAEAMKKRYRNKNIFYLGNVVNAAVDLKPAETLAAKVNSLELLFIGGPKYIDGAVSLIDAFKKLKLARPMLRLNIVGIKERDLGPLPDGVICHGYLDKARPNERDMYYQLLSKAKVLVNTTPKWGAFSATLEAMHFYTPIITSPYAEFVQTFGGDIDFGYYCEDNSVEDICAKVNAVFEATDYDELCRQAHARVEDYTWDTYVRKMLEKVEEVVPGVEVGRRGPEMAT